MNDKTVYVQGPTNDSLIMGPNDIKEDVRQITFGDIAFKIKFVLTDRFQRKECFHTDCSGSFYVIGFDNTVDAETLEEVVRKYEAAGWQKVGVVKFQSPTGFFSIRLYTVFKDLLN